MRGLPSTACGEALGPIHEDLFAPCQRGTRGTRAHVFLVEDLRDRTRSSPRDSSFGSETRQLLVHATVALLLRRAELVALHRHRHSERAIDRLVVGEEAVRGRVVR